jgi:3-oxoacyl-[acyl-carrier protein] reductase
MKSDLEMYDSIVEMSSRIGSKLEDICYKDSIPAIVGIISADWITPTQMANIKRELLDTMVTIKDKTAMARNIFVLKNKERGGLWKDIGLVGALVEIHAKLARLVFDSRDQDSLNDLYNYCAIAVMCIESGFIKVYSQGKKPVAVVTGDRQGLGKAIRDILVINGYDAPEYGVRMNTDHIVDFFHQLSKSYSKVDVLVNNFGINHLNWIGNMGADDLDVLIVNEYFPMMVVDQLVKRNLGPCRILNISSQTYRVAQRCTTAYCASKAAINQMTRVMARELAPRGFIVNALAPGKMVDTRMAELTDKQVLDLRGWNKEEADRYALSMIPMGRFTSTEEVALAAVKVLSLPPYINGSIIDMTGGV